LVDGLCEYLLLGNLCIDQFILMDFFSRRIVFSFVLDRPVAQIVSRKNLNLSLFEPFLWLIASEFCHSDKFLRLPLA